MGTIQKQVVLTGVYQKLELAHQTGLYNVFILEGGSRSSKTHSIIQFWITWAYQQKGKSKRVVVARLKATWITTTVLNDFINVLRVYGLYEKRKHNKSTGAGVYTLYSTEFWFLGLDDEQRIHGLTTDAFWINEAVEASFNDYAQLMQRCSGFAVLDYNPSYDEHWIYDKLCHRQRTCFMHSIMLDNPLIPDNSKEQIFSYEDTEENRNNRTVDKRKWEIYGLSKRASLEGQIYKIEGFIREIPPWIKRRGYGIDFGFKNNVTAIIDCAFENNKLYLDEVLYKSGMISSELIRFGTKLSPRKKMVESADDRLLKELKLGGFKVIPVVKGRGSVKGAIDVIQGYKIFVTERSINLIREFKDYSWAYDEITGKYTNEIPEGQEDDGMDGFRYWVMGEIMGRVKKEIDLTGVF